MKSLRFRSQVPIADSARAVLGVGFGLIIMFALVRIFVVNSFDFDNMRAGTRALLSGANPWASPTRVSNFYNPPFAVLFLWPMVFASPNIYLAIGGALLFGVAFYQRAWVALAWFATNTLLWLIAAGGIDMFVIGAGLLLLLAGDKFYRDWPGLILRVLAYGVLMVKPQGTIFIVVLYILIRRDWKGLLISAVVYGLLFLPWYPAWLNVLLHDPPLAQSDATHTFWAKFGPGVAGIIAVSVILARRWKYWQLGGALAGILTPYGMPGLPIFLVLTSVESLKAIPVIIIWSACLAALTWVSPPAGVDYYSFVSPRMAIYHLSMLGLALALACLSRGSEDRDSIAVGEWIRSFWLRLANKPKAEPQSLV